MLARARRPVSLILMSFTERRIVGKDRMMKLSSRALKDTVGLAALLVLWAFPAFAYVDPGSGSVIVTTILGFIAAIGYTFRKYFYRMRRTIFGSKTKDRSDDE